MKKNEENQSQNAGSPENLPRTVNEPHSSSAKEKGETRSHSAVIAEKILRAVNDGHLSSVEGSEEFLQKRAAVEDEPLQLWQPLLNREHGSETVYHGMQMICFGEKKDARYTVLYLHGGGYTEEAMPFHLHYCAKLAQRIGAYVLLPLYPLAPNHIWKETYDLLTMLYSDMVAEKSGTITIMGDSAGGGLAIAFCQYLKTIGLPQPEHLIGLSPWVDLCMEDSDYEPFRPLDPMLDVAGLQTYAKAWAGDLNVRDPRISPTFGDNRGLPKTLLFTGTRGIFYPDICEFYKKMRADGCSVELVIGEGMNHVYPLYGLPESKEAVARIDREITGGIL